MPDVHNDEMVQAVSSYGADQASAYGFCQGLRGAVSTSCICSEAIRKRTSFPVDAIPILNGILRRIAIGESLNDLLGRPGRGGCSVTLFRKMLSRVTCVSALGCTGRSSCEPAVQRDDSLAVVVDQPLCLFWWHTVSA
jgi:hypothetical protein